MSLASRLWCLAILLCLAPALRVAAADPFGESALENFSGRFVDQDFQTEVRLTPTETGLKGTLRFQGKTYPVTAGLEEQGITGHFERGGSPQEFSATTDGQTMSLEIGEDTIDLARRPFVLASGLYRSDKVWLKLAVTPEGVSGLLKFNDKEYPVAGKIVADELEAQAGTGTEAFAFGLTDSATDELNFAAGPFHTRLKRDDSEEREAARLAKIEAARRADEAASAKLAAERAAFAAKQRAAEAAHAKALEQAEAARIAAEEASWGAKRKILYDRIAGVFADTREMHQLENMEWTEFTDFLAKHTIEPEFKVKKNGHFGSHHLHNSVTIGPDSVTIHGGYDDLSNFNTTVTVREGALVVSDLSEQADNLWRMSISSHANQQVIAELHEEAAPDPPWQQASGDIWWNGEKYNLDDVRTFTHRMRSIQYTRDLLREKLATEAAETTTLQQELSAAGQLYSKK